MNPTALKHKITISNPTYYDDDDHLSGEIKPSTDWDTIVTLWSSYRDLSGNEYFAARQINAKLTGEFKIRYRSDIKTSYKIIWGERLFDITAARDIEGKKQWLYINVEEQFLGGD